MQLEVADVAWAAEAEWVAVVCAVAVLALQEAVEASLAADLLAEDWRVVADLLAEDSLVEDLIDSVAGSIDLVDSIDSVDLIDLVAEDSLVAAGGAADGGLTLRASIRQTA